MGCNEWQQVNIPDFDSARIHHQYTHPHRCSVYRALTTSIRPIPEQRPQSIRRGLPFPLRQCLQKIAGAWQQYTQPLPQQTLHGTLTLSSVPVLNHPFPLQSSQVGFAFIVRERSESIEEPLRTELCLLERGIVRNPLRACIFECEVSVCESD
ncbi:hypothetical protein M440DRAFT_1065033 [Trichoderma longibrachiatum ATCC 18648]|uniref:Uncharacterized protein n=1 Tax=Trichoderma longibrachiatum ATCC 18648 TaxID=983965 RepID=A0A2T4BW49_TRILO|nr:hypothetical protein M440DRAFT_1065033 [Trichoderma longibrachiatum ATCC 18648]